MSIKIEKFNETNFVLLNDFFVCQIYLHMLQSTYHSKHIIFVLGLLT